jgi:hypothetical protein
MQQPQLPGQSGGSPAVVASDLPSFDAAAERATSATISTSEPDSVAASQSKSPGVIASNMPLPIPTGQANAATPPAKRKTFAIKPLPQAASALLRATPSATPPPNPAQLQVQTDGGGTPLPPRGRIQRAATFLHRASSPQLCSGTELTELSVSSTTTSIVQFQLSFRNIKAIDVALLADPLAIVSCASGTPQGGARCWAELGRTECKANSTNPNFHHKIIVSLPRQDSATEDELLRVDVYDLGKAAVAGFDPSACSPSCYLGGVCFSARSIVQRLPSDTEAFTDPISLFFELIGSSSALSGSLPHILVQTPQEFNVMLAATPTPFCILQCCPVASNQSSFESYNSVQIASKYPRSSYANMKKCSTSVLSTLDRRDALVMTQSIAAYSYDARQSSVIVKLLQYAQVLFFAHVPCVL